MRKLMKFAHTLGAVGLLGTMVTLLVVLGVLPQPAEDLNSYALLTELVDRLARWLLLPSLAVTLVSGLLAMSQGPNYHSAGWAWMKLATGVTMFEGTLLTVQGPLQREAELTRQYLAGAAEMEALSGRFGAVANCILVLAGVAVVNVVLGVWRPRFSRRSSGSPEVAEQ
jgi:hypothetical protein